MMRATVLCLAAVMTAAVAATPTFAMPPAITAVGQQDRHPTMSFSAPRASSVSVYIASKPDRGTDGRFFSENLETTDFLTDSEIQSGRWLASERIDPGSYFVMLDATRDFTSCVSYDANLGEVVDPTCADGFSTVVPLTVPTPKTRFTVKSTVLENIHIVYLTLTGKPLGTDLPYQVCWKQRTGKKRCVKATLSGYSWSAEASDLRRISTKGMARRTRFTWYTRGSNPKVLTSKTITVS